MSELIYAIEAKNCTTVQGINESCHTTDIVAVHSLECAQYMHPKSSSVISHNLDGSFSFTMHWR